MSKNIIITIDGPAGSGKTSLAKLLAKKYSLFHLRGGTYFRTLTYAILESSIDPFNEEEVVSFAKKIKITIDLHNNYNIIFNKKNITSLLHSEKINSLVVHISNYKDIRKLRKKWILNISLNKNLIVDGRTFGSEIFPNATIKFYLTANLKKRAYRRIVDYNSMYTFDEIYKSLKLRDDIDKASYFNKLEIPQDAYYIDNSNLSLTETLNLFSKRIDNLL